MAVPVTHALSERIAAVLSLAPDSPMLEFDDEWVSRRRLRDAAQRVASHPGTAGEVGILLRNRPEFVAALLGVLTSGGTVVVVNPARGDDRTRADIAALRLPLIIGSPDDLHALVDPVPGTATLPLGTLDAGPHPSPATVAPRASGKTGVAVRMLTSGTTGPPKRIDLTYDMLARSVLGPDARRAPAPSRPRAGVAIVNAPLVHIGGVFRVLQCVAEARPFVLLPRFELDRWIAAVRTHRPRAVSLVPAALRTVLHSALGREDLASIEVVTSGTAPLSADDADAFHDKFGIPVLTSYAATEFGGGVAGWTLPEHRAYWHAKRGSVGRASGGARLRVVDDDGAVLPADRPGLLEVQPGQLDTTSEWIRTTDLARIDEEGFVWILGRADQAIIRGGFKILPDDVRAALEQHPGVDGAAVVAWPDDRLGEVPVALVELRDEENPNPRGIIGFLRTRLAPYEIPARIVIADALPRTPSGKADLDAVRALIAETPDGGGD